MKSADTEYQNATDPQKEFVWISASAGTGKTRMLVYRVIRLLISGQKNILCLTFTNAAAREIRERIYSIIGSWLPLSEKALVNALQEICCKSVDKHTCEIARKLFFNIPNSLTVQTMHSFCHSMISAFPVETGVSANFEIKDLANSYPKLFSGLLRDDRSIDPHLKEVAAEFREGTLSDIIYKIVSKKPVLTPPQKPSSPEIQFNTIKCPTEIIDALECGGVRDQKIAKKLSSWNHLTNKSHRTLKEYLKIFLDLSSLKKKNISSICSKKVSLQIATIIGHVQDEMLEFADKFYSNRIEQRTFHVMQIAYKFSRLYESDKKLSRYLDYNDIINLALNLISDPEHRDWVLFCLDSKIDHILIDESQDNSLEQWNIVMKLCDDFFSGISSSNNIRTLFVVGDVKQSIYSFQNARPDYFALMREHFSRKSNNQVIVQLHKSFRSAKPILLLVDKVFNRLRGEISLEYQEIRHEAHRISDYGYVEIWPLLSPAKDKNKPFLWDIDSLTPCNNQEICTPLAETIAETISTWIKTKRFLTSKQRPVSAGDIIILVRHRSAFVDLMIASLKQREIPVNGRDRLNIMDYVVIQDLINLGEFLLLQENDISLAALLKSPVFECTDDTLLEVASSSAEPCVPLWHKLQKFPPLNHIVTQLKELVYVSKHRSPLDLYCIVLSKYQEQFTQYFGQSHVEVTREFIGLLVKFKESRQGTLEAFIHWIKQTNPEIKSNVDTLGSSVRIMTVHNAKGMQAPIVFIPDTTSIPRCDVQVIFDEENNPMCCSGDTNLRCSKLKALRKQEEYNEYIRLLYVAITRAEDELYISGIGQEQKNSWYDIVTNSSPEIFTKSKRCLSPMFQDKVEILCINGEQQ